MTDAVVVSYARTGLAKSWRGALNMTHGATMGGHVVRHAIERAGLAPGEVDDVLIGCAFPEGATGYNIARQIAIRAGCPVTVPGRDGQPLLLVGPADDRAGGAAHHRRRSRYLRRRRRRIDLLRAERNEQAHAARGLARRAQARRLLADAGDGRERRAGATASRARSRTSTACKASSGRPLPRRRTGSTTKSCR